jgi:hypothetical protein
VSGQAHWSVAVTTIATGEQKVLFERGFAPRYLPTGHLLVAQEDVLLAMTLDLDTLTVGSPVAVLRGLLTSLGPGVAAYAVSDTGVLVHLTGALERDGWLVRLGPGVAPERLNKKPLDLEYGTGMALSPDGRRLAVARLENFDLWTFDLGTRDLDARVTTNVGGDYNPVWGPREGTLTFNSNQGGLRAIYSRRADGRGPVEPLLADRQALKGGPLSWSPDGTVLLVAQADPETKLDLWVVPAARSDAAQVFLRTEFNEGAAAFSPDGRWVAYASDETGRSEVYVTSYPNQGIKRRVSREGGTSPRWSSDGRLFFAWETRVMQVEATDSRWTPSTPETFVDGVDGGEIFRNWDVAPDGRSVIALEQRRPIQLHMVQNWFAELERLVPTD